MASVRNPLRKVGEGPKSRLRRDDYYEMKALLIYRGRLPKSTKIVHEKYIVGTLSDEDHADQFAWKELPHVRLANINTHTPQGALAMRPFSGVSIYKQIESGLKADPRAVQTFVQRYGPLWEERLLVKDGRLVLYEIEADNPDRIVDLPVSVADIEIENANEGELVFCIDPVEFAKAQTILRSAWLLDPGDAMLEVEGEAEEAFHLETIQVQYDFIGLYAKELWQFICYLFLRDDRAGKLGFCGNPDCPAPYFLKRRRTQKFCELGSCTAYAQRQYALKWWKKEGRERRAEKSAKTRKQRRKRK